jgi:hypothetical protein
MACVLRTKLASIWMSALPYLHPLFDPFSIVHGLWKLELVPLRVEKLTVALPQFNRPVGVTNMLELRQDQRVTRELLTMALAPCSRKGRRLTFDIAAKSRAVSAVEISKSDGHRNADYGLVGPYGAMQITWLQIASVKEPIEGIEDRRLPYAAASNERRELAEGDLKVSETTEPLDMDR